MKVFGETTQQRWFEIDSPRKQSAKSHESVFVKDNVVAFCISDYITGKSYRNPEHRYWRWETREFCGFHINKNGLVIPFGIVGAGRQRKRFNDRPFGRLNPARSSKATDVFTDAAQSMFGISGLSDIYPIAELYGIDDYFAMPKTLTRALRAPEMRSFTAVAFGKTRVRKDLVKAAAQTSVNHVALAREFRGLVPIDWIVGFLRENVDRQLEQRRGRAHRLDRVDTNGLRKILTQVNPRSYRHLLRSPAGRGDFFSVADILRIFPRNQRQIDGNQVFRTWEELHDGLIGIRRGGYIRQPIEHKDIALTPTAKKIHNLDVSPNVKIVCATNTSDLEGWGEAMSNCIGGYGYAATKGESVLAGVYSGDKLVANLEIRDNSLKQLLGRFNQPLNSTLRSSVETTLKEGNILVPAGYWGSD